MTMESNSRVFLGATWERNNEVVRENFEQLGLVGDSCNSRTWK